jgi:hypothetical protein
VCNNTRFYHFDDCESDYDYCTECNTAYDEEGNIIPEGPEPEQAPEDITPAEPEGQKNWAYFMGVWA